MESTRQAKIARLLQKELSELFRRQTAAMGGVLVSVSGVRVSPENVPLHMSEASSENRPKERIP